MFTNVEEALALRWKSIYHMFIIFKSKLFYV